MAHVLGSMTVIARGERARGRGEIGKKAEGGPSIYFSNKREPFSIHGHHIIYLQ